MIKRGRKLGPFGETSAPCVTSLRFDLCVKVLLSFLMCVPPAGVASGHAADAGLNGREDLGDVMEEEEANYRL